MDISGDALATDISGLFFEKPGFDVLATSMIKFIFEKPVFDALVDSKLVYGCVQRQMFSF